MAARDTAPPKRWLQPLLVVISAALTIAIQSVWNNQAPFQVVELGLRDQAQHLLARNETSPEVVVVDIDEDSLQALGAWPWPRSEIARLVDRLLQANARIVVLDMVLPNARDATGDQALAKYAQDRKLVLAQVFDYVERDTAVVSNVATGQSFDPAGLARTNDPTPQATGIIGNHTLLAQAPCVGNIGFIPDDDGKLRRLPELTQWQGRLYPSLGLATLTCLNVMPVQWQWSELASGTRALRFDREPESWTVIPARFVLEGNANRLADLSPIIQNKIVVVGASAMGLADRVATPLSPSISGVFVHAQSMTELIEGPSALFKILNSMITWLGPLVVVAAGVVLLQRLTVWPMVILLIALFLIWAAVGVAAAHAAVPGNVSAPLWGFLSLLVTVIPLQWALARQQARATTRLLARYVAKPVLRELLKRQNFDPLQPRKLSITVLVADMADYSKTTATQGLDASAQITREFLACITAPIWETRGTLDRYTGDGLVAFWGAPIDVPNQADHAIEAAREMLKKIDQLNQSFESRGLPRVSARIGIAAGEALVGDFGTQFRATYTAVGTCINLAARLEAKAKEFGLSVLISESVAEQSTQPERLRLVATEDIRGIGVIRLHTLTHS
jgi:adenylate cyclase